MASKDVISPSCHDDDVGESIQSFCMKVPMGYRLVCLDRDDLTLEFEMTEIFGIRLGLVVGLVIGLVTNFVVGTTG